MGLLHELSACIDVWLTTRRNASLPLLSRLSGVSYPTVRRIHQRESEPAMNNAVQILGVVASRDEARNILQRYYPELFQILGPEMAKQTLEEIAQLDKFTTDHFLILSLASTMDGVTTEEVKERLGRRGISALEDLEGVGAIKWTGDRYLTNERTIKIVNPDQCLAAISHLCDLFDFKRIDSRGSHFRIKTEGLTREAVLEIYRILYTASEAIENVIAKPESKGSIAFGVGIVSTFLRISDREGDL